MNWHDPQILVPLGLAWNGFFFGLLKYLFDRQVKVLDARLAKVDEIERRLTRVEVALENRGPCEMYGEHQATVKALHSRISAQNAAMAEQMQMLGTVSGRLDGLGKGVDMIQQHLLNERK